MPAIDPKGTIAVSPYEQLETRFKELHHLGHAQAMLSWDEAVMMPGGGGPRAARRLPRSGPWRTTR